MTGAYALSPVTAADLDAVHAIYADPATWRHLPSGRFTSVDQTAEMLAVFEREWADVGLGHWAVRAVEPWNGVRAGDVVGVAGVSPRDGAWWNLGYRFAPAAWGQGLAVEVAAAAVSRARDVRPDWPVVSRLLSNNPGSERVSLRIGLDLQWRGPTVEAHDLDRLVFADRPLGPGLLEAVVGLG